jgi:hypothetical protein
VLCHQSADTCSGGRGPDSRASYGREHGSL